jgi:hypothetical protein
VHDSLRVVKTSPANAVILWNEDPVASYNVYRGSRASLATWSYNQTCFDNDPHGESARDTAVPPTGTAFFYLVTRKNECGESIPGRDSTGTPEPNPSPCPEPPSNFEFQDEMDVGDDPLHAGCHFRYTDAECTMNKTFRAGDTCVLDYLLSEWTNAACHHNNDQPQHDCDVLCKGIGHFGGRCVVKRNFCGAGNDSAECQCFDALGETR